METITVTYTLEEAQAQLRLNDLAVRQGGLMVAEVAVVLSNKIREADQLRMQPKANNGKDAVDGTDPV